MSEDWYYIAGGQQQGPVRLEEMQGLVAAAKLSAQDLVWCAQMTQWTAVSAVPELSEPGALVAPAALNYQSKPKGHGSDLSIRLLQQTQGWIRFVGIVLLIGGGGVGVLSFAILLGMMGDARGDFEVLALLLPVAVSVLGGVIPGVLLNRYANRMGEAVSSRHAGDYEPLLRSQSAFWQYMGFSSILLIILTLVGLLAAGLLS